MSAEQYESISYISNILWHFKGKDDEPEEILRRIESLLKDDGSGELIPYKGKGEFYPRHLSFGNPIEDRDDPDNPPKPSKYLVLEQRAVCLCDIPLSYLPGHIKKYGDIGFGFRKKEIFSKAEDLQPVRYFKIKSEVHFLSAPESLWEIGTASETTEINLKPFIKIPTCFDKATESDPDKGSELFETIYEEREWRSLKGFTFTEKELAFIILPKPGLVT